MLPAFRRAPGAPPFLIAGPCVIESEALCLSIAERLQGIGGRLGMPVCHFNSPNYVERNKTTCQRDTSEISAD
jgi:2-dehydro-3-deoxyphosphooctonate aldolase (KDO 8-P synthase)